MHANLQRRTRTVFSLLQWAEQQHGVRDCVARETHRNVQVFSPLTDAGYLSLIHCNACMQSTYVHSTRRWQLPCMIIALQGHIQTLWWP